MDKHDKYNLPGRREFLTNVGIITGASMLSGLPGISLARSLPGLTVATYTVKQIMDIALSGAEASPKSVDLLRFGSPDMAVTGIVITTFPTIEVVNKTIKAGANMIISHEALFYNIDNNPARLKNSTAAAYKTDLLTKNNIAVFRFHDAWRAQKLDGIKWGNLVKLGWDKYYDPSNPKMITLPKAVTLASVVTLAKKNLDVPQVRVMGNMSNTCKTVYLAFGAVPVEEQLADINHYKPDLILSGESREWETVQRVRDGLSMGLNTKLIILGFDVSEEAGMAYAATWLAPKVQGVKVTHIASGTPFQYV